MKNSTPTIIEEPGTATSFLLYRAARLWQKHFADALRPLKMTPAQFGVLVHVGLLLRRKGPVSQTMLARSIHNDVMTISQIARTLEKKGLVVRVPNPRDSRANALSITPAGDKAVRQALLIVARAKREFFAPLAAQEPLFGRFLSRLIEFHDA
jgi:DNA-binding MarR family transcriptional regulator